MTKTIVLTNFKHILTLNLNKTIYIAIQNKYLIDCFAQTKSINDFLKGLLF